MTTPQTNPKVNAYFQKAKQWPKELEELRKIILDCGLTEELKWGKPCYSFEGSNLVVLLPLKNYCAVLWCKGALLKDPAGLLVKAGENTQAARQTRFTALAEIVKQKARLKAYIQEAIQAEKAGLKVTYKKIEEFALPAELQKQLDKSAKLKAAFKALTPGRQRFYIIHISSARD
jgi:uncharacterized protein YdeI (YjbR/CyaY-like superfamily)